MDETEVRRLDIERLVAGELRGSAKSLLEEHLTTCAACSAYLSQLRAEQDEFLHEHPFSSLRWVKEERGRESWFGRLMGAVAIPALRPVLIPLCLFIFAGVLLLPFIGRVQRETPRPGLDVRYKGTSTLTYIYKRNGAVREAAPGDTFFAGDAIQIFYASKADQYVSLFSIDNRGAVSFYQPDEHSLLCRHFAPAWGRASPTRKA